MAECLGFDNLTKKDNFVKIALFYCLFFQTALIPLLGPMNRPNVERLMNGVYTNLNMEWFCEVGRRIITTMTINIFWPVIEFSIFYLIRHAYRMYDQGKFWPNDLSKTKTQTIKAFEEMYCGEIFLQHWKYSMILNIVFVTFLFGAIMPILFPIAWCQLFVLYAVERLMMFYSYQRFPIYEDSLT